jgi:predicted nucleic acid-binding Zn ribbon protein
MAESVGALDAQAIINACDSELPTYRDDCHKFLYHIDVDLGFSDFAETDQADDQIAKLIMAAQQAQTWYKLIDGNHADAKQHAALGHFVVGGLTSDELGQSNGHVVVVVKHDSGSDPYPWGYWGSISNDASVKCPDGGAHLRKCFTTDALTRIHYFFRSS